MLDSLLAARGCGPSAYRGSFNYRDPKPVPPLSEYEAYQETLDKRCRKSFQPVKWRRAVIMLRGGGTFADVARALNFKATRKNYMKLPEHLR